MAHEYGVPRHLKAGNSITVYEDPITCEREEGKATLVRLIFSNPEPFDAEGHQLEQWLVRFEGDAPGEHYQRTIKVLGSQ